MPSVRASVRPRLAPPTCSCRAAGIVAQHTGEGWKENESQHHGKVFDDQPADGDAAVDRVEGIAFFKSAQQHDRAGDRERQAEHQAGAERPAPQVRNARDEHRDHRDPPQRAGNGDAAHRQQILDREVEADPEHQQDDADFRELARQPLVRHEAGREGTDGYAGQQVTDERRQLQFARDEAAGEGEDQAHDDGGDQSWSLGTSAVLRHVE